MKYNFSDLLSENKRELTVVVRSNVEDPISTWTYDVSEYTAVEFHQVFGYYHFYIEVLP